MQSLYPDQFDELMTQVRQIAPVVGRTIPAIGTHPPAGLGTLPGIQSPASH
jgi:hypothetical protein